MTAVELTVRSATEILEWGRACVGPALRAAVDTLPESMRRIAGYHLGWLDETGRPTGAAGGKALRPALALLGSAALGGDPNAALPVAVAVELVHNFSLLHDDVMDGDRTRRHRPTAWAVFGRNGAILAGDALLALAFQVGGSPAAVTALNTCVQRLLDGQSADLAFELRSTVDLAECRAMAGSKTGALLGCAVSMGAWAAGGEPDRVAHLRAFGERLGLAFQLADDLLGIWGDPALTGKPVHSDLRSRKKSFPVVAALSSGTPAGRELTNWYARSQPHVHADLAHVAALVERAGGRAWAQGHADLLLDEALTELAAARPHALAAAELTALAQHATRRDT
jgi:geranylgeranyl diphosphate synthase type I